MAPSYRAAADRSPQLPADRSEQCAYACNTTPQPDKTAVIFTTLACRPRFYEVVDDWKQALMRQATRRLFLRRHPAKLSG